MSAITLPSKKNIAKLLRLYDTTKTPILIHCRGGADRTGEAAAIWKIIKQNESKHKAKKQLSLKYRHFKIRTPEKDFFIKIFKGKNWALKKYNPKNYPKHRQPH